MSDLKCPECGKDKIDTTTELEKFYYNMGPNKVELTALVPVHACRICKFQYTDYKAEDLRHEAVCHHLNVLPPAQITYIRNANLLSIEALASSMKIDKDTVLRWERGALIQTDTQDIQLRSLGLVDDTMTALNACKLWFACQESDNFEEYDKQYKAAPWMLVNKALDTEKELQNIINSRRI